MGVEGQSTMGAETPRKQACWVKPLWLLLIAFTVLVSFLAVIRIAALSSRSGWRSDQGSSFPEACGSWAEANGCTRVTMKQDGCIRPEKIVSENSLILPTGNDALVNSVIAGCIDDLSGAKLMSPDNFASSQQSSQTVHVTVNSFFFGFLDDLYLVVDPNTNSLVKRLSMQS